MRGPLKILYITTVMPYGLGEPFFISEVKAMINQGHNILIVPRSPTHKLINDDAKELVSISLPKPILSLEILAIAFYEVLINPLKFIQIFRMLFSGNFTTLMKNLAVVPKSLWLSRLAKKLDVHHIHAQWGLTTATMAMIASKLSGIPWSFTAHRGDIAGNNLLEIKMQDASFVRFISKSGLEMARVICNGEIKGQTHIIHMGVQIPSNTEQSKSLSDIPVILCPANLIPVKGHRYLLEALSILQNRGLQCALILAGKGELRKEIEEQANTLNISDHVTFLGQIPHNELLDLYRKHKVSIVVLPSYDMGNNVHEGIPVSLMEAMSYGIPCISTTTGGIPELLENGAGLLVPPKDSHALADAIQKLFQDNGLKNRLAENGYRRILKDFNIDILAEELISLIATSDNPRQ